MEKYENLGILGEGSYGMVMKCRHKETGQVVAVKKFLETEDDKMVKKIAVREVKMLKQVRHENLINLLEVFRRKKRLYLVFEFVDHTALDDLERYPNGAEENYVKKIMWQVLKGVEFCHVHNIIHRDVKPENILISKRGVVKLCDFGFARTLGEVYTDYVATRWYRAPELLVGDTSYGRAVDIWAIGCLFSEMLTGEPLFPGESDIDQLHLIMKCFGNLIGHHREIFRRNPLFIGMRLPEPRELESFERRYSQLSPSSIDIIKWSLRLDPSDRPSCSQLLRHEFFTMNGWIQKFTGELRSKIEKEFAENPLIRSLGITIYGSVHDTRQREKADRKAKQEVAQVHSEVKNIQEGRIIDADGRVRRKEKKKKLKKDVLLTRDKAPRGLQVDDTKAVVPTKLPLTTSQTSLTASQSHLSPRILTPRRQLPPTPHSPSSTTLPPVTNLVPQSEGISSYVANTSTHLLHPSHSQTSTPTPHHKNLATVYFKSPPSSVVNVHTSKSMSGMPSTDAIPLHSDSKTRSSLTSTMSGVSHHPHPKNCNTPPVLKKQISKNTDPLLLPYLKEDNPNSRIAPHSTNFGTSVLNTSKKDGFSTDRPYIHGAVPHLSQIDTLLSSTSSKSQYGAKNVHNSSTTFHIV